MRKDPLVIWGMITAALLYFAVLADVASGFSTSTPLNETQFHALNDVVMNHDIQGGGTSGQGSQEVHLYDGNGSQWADYTWPAMGTPIHVTISLSGQTANGTFTLGGTQTLIDQVLSPVNSILFFIDGNGPDLPLEVLFSNVVINGVGVNDLSLNIGGGEWTFASAVYNASVTDEFEAVNMSFDLTWQHEMVPVMPGGDGVVVGVKFRNDPNVVTTPEPSSAILLGMGTLVLLRRRR